MYEFSRKMRIKKFSLIVITITIAILTNINIAFSDDKTPITLPVLICPFGCGPMAGDTILMNQMIRTSQPIQILPQESPGYIYNIREMQKEKHWTRTAFSDEDTAIQLAAHGGSKEVKDYFPKPVVEDFKLMYGEAWWGIGKFLVTFDPDLKGKKWSDLKGKSISIGLRSQSDWGVYPKMFLEEYGITSDNADIRHMTPQAMVQQLSDGATDVITAAIGAEPNLKEWLIPGPMRQLEAVGKPLYYLGIEESVVDRFNKKWGTTFLYVELPAGTMPRQTEPVGVAFNRGYKVAHSQLPDETAYRLVKSVAELGPQMKELHGLWKIWSPELMLHGLSEENVHPGAKRAYVELGWWDKHKEFSPVILPKKESTKSN